MADNISDLIIGGDPATYLLQEAFAFDITLTKIQCDACSTVSGLGSLVADGGPQEALVRCATCGNDLIRAARTPNGRLLELNGARHLYF
ncbi:MULTISPECIES: DUF6510 family protein [unclassified Bradyrhizobium]|uniref:DUF6510 family protein n=1 Tax=unclassified Bradyrhizobium TaxID=2631580 RepID=UPI0020B2F081|nr:MULTISPECIES: DUF6510 family protein [unclassified Bradyrhizobium]MCP3402741.1 DUF6510 family protein [Bradyrhizobium sp. CCGB20]MCP3411221.1 DUF6510 family protein [Bradyrhizobium sp. CCGB01]